MIGRRGCTTASKSHGIKNFGMTRGDNKEAVNAWHKAGVSASDAGLSVGCNDKTRAVLAHFAIKHGTDSI